MPSLFERVDRLLLVLSMRLSRHRVVDGMWIGTLAEDGSDLLPRLESAIAFIREHDSLKHKYLLKTIRRIWLSSSEVGACYRADLDLIVLDTEDVRTDSDEVIASMIVHESTHARLKRFDYLEGRRARIERCCLRREIAFARRHPQGEPIIAWVSEALSLSEDHHSNVALAERAHRGKIARLRDSGAPGWLVNVVDRFATHALRRYALAQQRQGSDTRL